MTKNSYNIQELTISSNKWKVDLGYKGLNSLTKTNVNDIVIELSKKGESGSVLKIDITDEKSKRTCIVTGIQGGVYLYKRECDNNSQSVKIENNNLILSLGLTFISIDLNEIVLNWKLEPDIAEVFEFYDLDNDYLLRGEVGIHRIDISGQVKWTFSATDIWVNMEGKAEVEIAKSSIKLLDFNSDHYEIDFNGKEIKS